MNNTTWQMRLDRIRDKKLAQTEEKIRRHGRTMNGDDKGLIPYDGDFTFLPEPNHENGSIYGTRASGANFRKFLACHPLFIDPDSSLAGGWMDTFSNYARIGGWKPEYDYSFLNESHEKYDLVHGIGAGHHFCADVKIGMKLGWQGIVEKIRENRKNNPNGNMDFYTGEEDTALGIQEIIKRHADAAFSMAEQEQDPTTKENLVRMAAVNARIATEPPQTFYEACHWLSWFILTFNMYNGCGAALGAIDTCLYPYYAEDMAAGILGDEEAIFHLACLMVKDNFYCQIGGMFADGSDRTNAVSFLMLEATHRLGIPTNVCVRVHENLDPKLLRQAVEYMFEDSNGTPSFLGDYGMHEGFMRNGYSMELAVTRERSGCHWCNIPGREYTLNDCVKINFAKVFEVALQEMIVQDANPSTDKLWQHFETHLKKAVDITAEGIDFHLSHMEDVFPELPMSLLCQGTLEIGADASNGAKHPLEYYNMCVDGAGLAIVADSFSALRQRIEIDEKITWPEIMTALADDYKDAEVVRLMMRSTPRYGSGNSIADKYAVDIVEMFNRLVKAHNTPELGYPMIPGLFSWANTIPMGKTVGATPDGRHAHAPISHGANPTPGFKEGGALTAMAKAVASVQCGYGNTTPIQLELDPLLGKEEGGVDLVVQFINTYCNDLKGTLMNLNIINKQDILDAHRDPAKYPDLIVRVTGFSAYFAALSEDFRQLVVDRIIEGM